MQPKRIFRHACQTAAVLLVATDSSWSTIPATLRADEPANVESRDLVSITMLEMDLTEATKVVQKHDLDDNGSLNATERERLGWDDAQVRRFDLNRDGEMQHLEIALKLADRRLDDGIVQMDWVLAERYTQMYDRNRDRILQLEELSDNVFSDQVESFDKNSDGELSSRELIVGLAFERRFRDELGIKGCDQGGAMKLINRGDENKDKRIDSDELESVGLTADAMKFDRNGDGLLSVSELAERLAERRNRLGLTPSDQLAARGILRNFDKDLDGMIGQTEMPAAETNSPILEFDRNRDGQITETELESVMGERRKELGFNDEQAKRASILIQRNDQDNSRSLSRSELVSSGSDRNSPLSPTKLPIIDTDGNRSIDLSELARYLYQTRTKE